jgi:conjugal transfer mating pair stabilization protein TraN
VKTIAGLAVRLEQVGGCWEYKSTYECIDPNITDYCAALDRTPGCGIVSSQCEARAHNNECVLNNFIYRCGAPLSDTDDLIVLNDTHTIVYDYIDDTQCDILSNSPTCQSASTLCVEGPETRNINGLDVYKDCWRWSKEFACIASNQHDYCAPLRNAGCTNLGSQCSNYAFTGSCIERNHQFICGEPADPLPERTVHLDTTYVLNDHVNDSLCSSMNASPGCSVASQTCSSGPETRIIDGREVYRDCWLWDKSYVCTTDSPMDNCSALESNPLCSRVDTACVEAGEGAGCALYEHQYRCVEADSKTVTEMDCDTQKFCVAGECFDTGYSPDQDFQLAIAMKEMMREAGSYEIFQGEAGFCQEKLWGVGNCCKAKGGGEAGKNSNMVSKMGVAGAMYAAERVIEFGSSYLYDALFEYTASATYAFMGEAAASALEQGLFSGATPSATLSMYGVSWSSSAGLAGQGLMGANQALGASPIGGGYLYFNPYMMVVAVVTQVIMNYLECSEDEQILAMKRGQRLCYHVGTFCSSKVLGSCEKKKQGWCCFPSVLGRIVNEQGRRQIGKGWGNAKSPDCAGFTGEELQMLRFDEMDLSEFLATVTQNVKGIDSAKMRLEERVIREPKSYYELKRGTE